jgi:tetratricopeptide (TPR) repeat protein
MQPMKTFPVLGLGWLAVTAILSCGISVAEQPVIKPIAVTADRGSGKRAASDTGQLAVMGGLAVAQLGMMPCSQAILSPHLSDLERRLFDQFHGGSFGEFSLLEAGLIAGGIDCLDELHRYCQRFDTHVESLRRSGKVSGTPRKRAQAVFAFLHHSILHGGYDLQASDLRQAFDHGRFNCVTASLLFNCLAQRFELKAVGLELPGHAMSRLKLPDETLDIETTCPRWFTILDRSGTANSRLVSELKPADNETVAQSELARKALASSAATCRQPLRQISDAQLVAMIYYNRGVDLLAERQFTEAAAANSKAVRLDPDNTTAKGNLLATINNWAIVLGTSGEYEKAVELLRLGLAKEPSYEAFHSNYIQLFRQWSDHLCRDGRYDDAVRLLSQAAREHPQEKFFHEASIEVLRRWADK